MTDTPWLEYAIREAKLGVKEFPGAANNPKIVKWGKDSGIDWWHREDAWCAVFVNAMLLEAGIPGTRSALARSFLDWGLRLNRPEPGAIVVFPRGSSDLYGHVGIVEEVHANGTITIVNGNVSDMVKRSVFKISSILLGGIRWPMGVGLPNGVRSTATTTEPHPRLGSRDLKIGMRGGDVAEWQRLLNNFGYKLKADGIFGEGTRDATMLRQRHAGLVEDGIVGPATLSTTRKDLQDREAAAENSKAEDKGAGKGAAIGGAAVGGAAIAVDQGIGTIERVKNLFSPEIGGLIAIVLLLGALSFGLYWFVIRPRRAQKSEATPHERREVDEAAAMFRDRQQYAQPEPVEPVEDVPPAGVESDEGAIPGMVDAPTKRPARKKAAA